MIGKDYEFWNIQIDEYGDNVKVFALFSTLMMVSCSLGYAFLTMTEKEKHSPASFLALFLEL